MKILKIFLMILILSSINVSFGAVNGSTVLIIDDFKDNSSKQMLLYTDEEFNDAYEYPGKFGTDDDKTVNYTIVIQEEYIDLVNDQSFITDFTLRYGNLIISSIIIVFVIGFMIYIYKKGVK